MQQNPKTLQCETATIAPDVIRLAEHLLMQSRAGQTNSEKNEAAQMARLMKDARGKAFLFAMVDEVFRSRQTTKQAKHWRYLLCKFGVPHYPSPQDRLLMRLGAGLANFAPQIVMPAVAAKMRSETRRVILDGETQA